MERLLHIANLWPLTPIVDRIILHFGIFPYIIFVKQSFPRTFEKNEMVTRFSTSPPPQYFYKDN